MKNIKRITIMSCIMLCFWFCKSFAVTGVVNIPATRLRKAPNTESDIITNIYEDDQVSVLEDNGEWCKIEYDGNTGYVKTEFLKIDGKESNTNTSTENTVPQSNSQENTISNTPPNTENQDNSKASNESSQIPQTTNSNTTKISLRLLPNITSKVIAEIDATKQLNQIAEMNNWVKVTDGAITGWISKVKLSQKQETPEVEMPQEQKQEETPKTEEQPQEEKTTETNINKTGRVNVETAKVREKPDSSATVVDFLDYNDEVTISAEEGEWYKVTSGNISGYVNKRLITVSVSSRSLTENREETENKTENSIDDTVANENTNNSVNDALSKEVVVTTGVQVAEYAKQYIGYSYVSGGKTPSTGFDCSGFTKYIYSNFGYTLGNTAASQNNIGIEVSIDNLNVGDLILFYDEGKTKIGHTGIYVGDGNFVHAANANRGVVTDNLNTNSYYNSRFVTAKRIVE